jgi:hypothetical protein
VVDEFIEASVLKDALEDWLAWWDHVEKAISDGDVYENELKEKLTPWIEQAKADVYVKEYKGWNGWSCEESEGPIVWKYIEHRSGADGYTGLKKLATDWKVEARTSKIL